MPTRPDLRRWWDRLLVLDPGLTGLRRATRGTGAVVGGVFSVYLLLQAAGIRASLTVPLLAGMVALQATFAATAPTIREQQTTLGLQMVTALGCVAIGTELASNRDLQSLALLLLIFGAFFIRRYGNRYRAAGMIGFMTFYFSSLVHTTVPQLPQLAGAIVAGAAWAAVFAFLVLPDRPAQTARRMLRACTLRAALLLDRATAVAARGRAAPTSARALDHAVVTLHAAAVAAAELLGSADGQAEEQPSAALRVFLFDVVLAIETIARAVGRLYAAESDLPSDVQRRLLTCLRMLRDAFRDRDLYRRAADLARVVAALETASEATGSPTTPPPWLPPVRRVTAACRWIIADVQAEGPILTALERTARDGRTPLSVPAAGDGGRPSGHAAGAPASPSGDRPPGRVDPGTAQAIQATVAGLVSIILGYVLSPTHQYWTVLAAFVVLANAGSIAKAYRRALHRVGGTLLGAVAGFGVAALVAGDPRLEVLFAFVCVFFALYLFSLAYGLMVFWVTVLLALMYDILLGGINAQLLQARFLDTLVGAAVGLLMSTVILPTRTSDEVRAGVTAYLAALEDFVRQYLATLRGEAGVPDHVETALALDAMLQKVRDDASAVLGAAGARQRSGIARVLSALAATNYYAGHLADPVTRRPTEPVAPETKALLAAVQDQFSANVRAVNVRLSRSGEARIQDPAALDERIESTRQAIRPAPAGTAHRAPHDAARHSPAVERVQRDEQDRLYRSLHYIWLMNHALADLALDLGAKR
jgi:uncharacterized membrane protein YccC